MSCLNQMREERRDTSEFTRSLEVSCCIYAKLQDCLKPHVPNCANETISLIQYKILHEFKLFDNACTRYEYPSARCWIFFHQWCFFSIVFFSLMSFGVFVAAVATNENRRRKLVRQSSGNRMALSRVHDSGQKPHMEFPPPPSYQECVEHPV